MPGTLALEMETVGGSELPLNESSSIESLGDGIIVGEKKKAHITTEPHTVWEKKKAHIVGENH